MVHVVGHGFGGGVMVVDGTYVKLGTLLVTTVDIGMIDESVDVTLNVSTTCGTTIVLIVAARVLLVLYQMVLVYVDGGMVLKSV